MIQRHRTWIYCAAGVPVALFLSMPAAIAQPVFEERVIHEHPKPAATQPVPRVAELIAELSADSWEKRQAGAQLLLGMGPKIQPQLQWALEREQSAVPAEDLRFGAVPGNRVQMGPGWLLPRHAYHELRVLIDHMAERGNSAGSVITLRHKDAPLPDVLRDLGKQADAELGVVSSETNLEWVDKTRVTVDVEGANLWQALRALQRNTGVGPVYYAGHNRLMLDMKKSSVPLDAPGLGVSGPILIVPLLAQNDKSLRLILQAFVEPKVSNAGEHAKVELDECVDEQGRSLLAPGPRAFASSPNERHWIWKVPIDLASAGTLHRIKSIKGRFSIGIGPADEIMTLGPLSEAKGKSIRLDGVEILVKQFVATGSQHRIDLDVSAPADSPYMRFTTDTGVNVWDASRKTMRSQASRIGIRHEAGRDVASWSLLTAENAPAPATLVWKSPSSPAETRWFTLPFELHDIAVTPAVDKK
jgi:hypothetical protein